MEKKALFIHGLHSDSDSTTGGIVAEILKEYGYETIHPTFDLLNCKETTERLEKLIHDENINLVAAHSLGGFYGFCLSCENAIKILINPCLKPEINIPGLMYDGEVFPENLKEEWSALRKAKHNSDINALNMTYGIFAKDDDLFSYADYAEKELNIKNIYRIEGNHKPTKNQLTPAINSIMNHNNIGSLNL